MMKTVVFAGPSIHGLDLGRFSELTFLPPAAAGDLLAVVRSGAKAIGLVDGLYGDCAAVWHKEILYALSLDIAVLGAASMGALRAAECHAFGMIGVGQIFRQYSEGERVSDADVALSHAPAELGFSPLTVSLVDAEATIAACETMLGRGQRARLTEAARELHFTRRSWKAVVDRAGLDPGVASILAGNLVSVKREDARLLLEMLVQGSVAGKQPSGWSFQDTVFFRQLLARQGVGQGTGKTTAGDAEA